LKQLKLFIHKLTHWEYWPFDLVYTPVYVVWFYYSFKAKSFFFFNAANPSIKNGGFLMEPKKEIYDMLPAKYIPKTLAFTKNTNANSVALAIHTAGIQYPCIAKPDIGMKGLGVEKLESENDIEKYINRIKVNFLVQELITYPNEVGIFYYRYPHQKKGTISGIVYKEFLTVTGNGTSTLLELIEANPRYYLQLGALQKKYANYLLTVPAQNEVINLVPFGNHARGAKFIDASHWKTPALENTIEAICSHVPNFHFGRLDIKYNTFEELERGENFSIIELNAAGSEPTHIYDPKHSLLFALKEIIRHVTILYEISVANKKLGFSYLTFKQGVQMFKENNQQVKKLKAY
jgi:hypothetical protein